MKLVEETTDDVTVVEVYGRVDSTTAKAFGDRLVDLVQAGSERILVDLKNIVYISSAGFRALLIASRASAEQARQACPLRGERRGQASVRDRRFYRTVSDLPDAG